MEHLEAGQWEEPQGVEVSGAEIRSQVVFFRPGLVLYGKLRPYLNKVFVPRYEGVASTEFVPIAPRLDVLSPEYLGAYLRTPHFVAYATANTTGSRQPRTRLDALWSALIPLPPLSEQRRIVARIEALMARVREARRLRQAAREEAERLWQSVLADTFPRPGSPLPSGWRWVRLGEIFDIQQGASMSPKRRIRSNPKPFLRTKNVLWGTVDLSSVDEMDFTDEEVEKLRLQPGDLLVCEGGDVGRTAIWEGQLPLVLYQNHIHRLRARDNSIEPRFILYWMQAAYQVFFTYQGTESRTAIPNLSGYRLKQFLAPLPPLAEQRRIAAHLEAVQEKIRALRAAQAETEEKLKRLEQAILDKAFRGEL
jgi:type I restriction enzyme S subunit